MLTLWVLGRVKPKTKGYLSRYAIRIHRDVFVSDLSQSSTHLLHTLVVRIEGRTDSVRLYPYRKPTGFLPEDPTSL